MYIHAYKLNFEYNLKNMHFARQDPAPYWNEGWLARLMISMRFSNVQNFELFPVIKKYQCRCV